MSLISSPLSLLVGIGFSTDDFTLSPTSVNVKSFLPKVSMPFVTRHATPFYRTTAQAPTPTMTTKRLYLDDDHLALDFPYDPNEVARIKAIDGARWDKIARIWRVPMTSLAETRDFAQELGFTIEPEVLVFTLPKPDNDVFGIKLDDKWVHLSFAYDPVRVRAVKQIPGVTWDAKTKAWKAPHTSARDAIRWAENFRVTVPQQLFDLAAELEGRQSALVDASKAVDADIEVAGLPLLPYQRAGVQYASNARRTFIADDMGLGKTIQAIATLEYVYDSYPAVVVCPSTLVLNWAKEYARWLPDRKVATVTNRRDFPADGFDVLIVGWSNVAHWEKSLTGFRSYIFDESHYAKTPTAQRTKAAVKIAKTAPPEGLVLCLTGTPVTNRPAEYAPQLQILGKLDKFGGLWGFYRRYCAAFRDKWGQWHLEGHSNLDELNEKLRAECYIRRTKDQVLKELPAVRHAPVTVEPSDAGLREYRKAEADIVAYFVERAKELALELGVSPKSAAVRAKMAAEANTHLIRISILRRLAAKAKMAAVKEWVESRIEAGQKVVIAAHHREIVDELSSMYGGLKIQGGMEVETVEEMKAKFQDGDVSKAPVIVLSIQAAKTGHTLTSAQDVLFVELPWTPADVDQTYSRCHRLGQRGCVTATYMLAAGTIDEDIYNIIEKKRSVVTAATDGGDGDDSNIASEIINLFTKKAFD